MDRAEAAGVVHVEVVYSPKAGEVWRVELSLHEGASAADALQASGVALLYPEVDITSLQLGVWGKLKTLDAALRDRDRVEIYRPLKVDPKEARRQRYQRHRLNAKR